MENIYFNQNLEQYVNNNNVYVFNWGYLPEGMKQGIEPNKDIKWMIRNKKEKVQQQVNNIKQFMQ